MLRTLLENVFVRIALYMVSGIVGLLPGWALSWVQISFDGVDWITLKVSVQGLVTAVLTASGMAGGIFAKWGKR